MHFSQQDAEIHTIHRSNDVVCATLTGFITSTMLARQFSVWDSEWSNAPRSMLVDLRLVSGYGPGIASLVKRRLIRAHQAGVRRVALIASSAVLRTAARVFSEGLQTQVRCFSRQTTAESWLGPGVDGENAPLEERPLRAS